jgi:methionine sulfoxide reductase heme-binding subunit
MMASTIGPPNEPPGSPLGGTNGDLRHRVLQHHLPLALGSALVVVLWMVLSLFQAGGHQGSSHALQSSGHQSGTGTVVHQSSQQHTSTEPMDHSGGQTGMTSATQNRLLISIFTSATGYVALALLAITLLIGPGNLMLRRRTPISSYLARDVGIWAAIFSVIHVIVGIFVHGPPAPLADRIRYYFIAPEGTPLTNSFGWANWTGLAATLIVLGLLTISSNFALGKLKARNWKNLQRLNYVLFALVVAHAILYGALRRITSITTLLLGVILVAVLTGQLVGIGLWRRRRVRSPGSPA